MTYISEPNVGFKDTFLAGGSRLQTAEPVQLFEDRHNYNVGPLLWETVTNVNGTVSHLPNESGVSMSIPTASGDKLVRQTYEHYLYTPSKPLKIEFACLHPAAKANLRTRVGAFTDNNGFFLQRDNTTLKFVRRTFTSGSAVDTAVNQSSWNVDKLDGTGRSGKTLDIEKIQMVFIEYLWYGAGTIRLGFEIEGDSIIAHEFYGANSLDAPISTTGNLPIRYEIENTGATSGTSALKTYGASVVSDGGFGLNRGFLFSQRATLTASSAARTHAITVRPKTTFNSITNRAKFSLESIDVLVTGSNPVFWEICYGQALTSPTWTDVNATYSTMEYDTAGTLSGSPALVGPSGFVAATNKSVGAGGTSTVNALPITLDAAGNNRTLGQLTVLITGLGGTSATQVCLNWREVY